MGKSEADSQEHMMKVRHEKALKVTVTKLGSNWNNGSNAGSFYWNVNNASSNRNRNISGQLLNAQK